MRPTSPHKTDDNEPGRSLLGNEHGAALILAIAMLAILSVLGSLALMTSNTEMKITGNYQTAKQTYMVVDRAVEYATSRNILMTMGTDVDLMVADSGAHKTTIEIGGGGVMTAGVVEDLGARPLPAKLAGVYGTDFGANFYHVSVTAQQSTNAASAAVRVDTEIVRLFKNDDDSIFRTTGSGG